MEVAILTSSQIQQLDDILCDNLDWVLDVLGVKLVDRGKYLCGPCPIHGGDNPSALNIYTDGHTKRGNWVCNTHHCEKKYIPTAIGFVRAVLNLEKQISFPETLDWIIHTLEIDPKTLTRSPTDTEKTDFIRTTKILNNRKTIQGSLTPTVVKKNLISHLLTFLCQKTY